jgi:hypothetical protein
VYFDTRFGLKIWFMIPVILRKFVIFRFRSDMWTHKQLIWRDMQNKYYSFFQATDRLRKILYTFPTEFCNCAFSIPCITWSVFGERIISCGLWPSRSPNITPGNFFLWGYWRNKVYQTNPHMKEELRNHSFWSVLHIQRTIACDIQSVQEVWGMYPTQCRTFSAFPLKQVSKLPSTMLLQPHYCHSWPTRKYGNWCIDYA